VHLRVAFVLLRVDILQAIGLSCEMIGGSSACCGINQFRAARR